MILTLSSVLSRRHSYHSQADSAGLIGPVTHLRRIGTATWYRNTTTATCGPAGLVAGLPCSASNMGSAVGRRVDGTAALAMNCRIALYA